MFFLSSCALPFANLKPRPFIPPKYPILPSANTAASPTMIPSDPHHAGPSQEPHLHRRRESQAWLGSAWLGSASHVHMSLCFKDLAWRHRADFPPTLHPMPQTAHHPYRAQSLCPLPTISSPVHPFTHPASIQSLISTLIPVLFRERRDCLMIY